jgi:hypothetical protein
MNIGILSGLILIALGLFAITRKRKPARKRVKRLETFSMDENYTSTNELMKQITG